MNRTSRRPVSPARAGRSLWLVDLENLSGGSDTSEARIAEAWQTLAAAIARRPGDQVVVGSGPEYAAMAWFLLPAGIKLVVREGRHGGERALLDVFDVDHAAARFERLVIASGDHAFVRA